MKQEIQHKIYGVSLGPGDPSLITVKGLEILQSVDVIYYPGSQFSNGSQSSYSLSIMEDYDIDPSKLRGFFLEMNLDRKQANQVYQETFQSIESDFKAGKSIAVVSEGDLSTFSSFSYLLSQIQHAKIPFELIPGITSYALGASEIGEPLCLQNERLIILPRVPSSEELSEAIQQFDTVVLMKIRSVMSVIQNVIETDHRRFYYCERLGTHEQYITTNWEDLKQRSIPYFSLMILKK